MKDFANSPSCLIFALEEKCTDKQVGFLLTELFSWLCASRCLPKRIVHTQKTTFLLDKRGAECGFSVVIHVQRALQRAFTRQFVLQHTITISDL